LSLGLTEATETVIAFGATGAWPTRFATDAWIFTALALHHSLPPAAGMEIVLWDKT
jgi:hypothetical protein